MPLAGDEGDLLKVDHQALPDGEGKRLPHQHLGAILAAGEVQGLRYLAKVRG
ncbi:hypothetical protein D3C80_2125930 [compost metagenome]